MKQHNISSHLKWVLVADKSMHISRYSKIHVINQLYKIKHTAVNIQKNKCATTAAHAAGVAQGANPDTHFSTHTIETSWKRLCGYDRDDMSCQDFCTVCLFHPITPSVSSTWFLMSSAYMLYFLVFLFLWWFHKLRMLFWECYYIMWTANPSSSI